jgi:hypothetical protein
MVFLKRALVWAGIAVPIGILRMLDFVQPWPQIINGLLLCPAMLPLLYLFNRIAPENPMLSNVLGLLVFTLSWLILGFIVERFWISKFKKKFIGYLVFVLIYAFLTEGTRRLWVH